MARVHLIYTLRPKPICTALWLPADMAAAMGVERGDQLTRAQYSSKAVQELLDARLNRRPGDELV